SANDDRVAWYENNGDQPPSWFQRNISTTADGAEVVDAADMDADGDIDVLSASFNDDTVAWYENDGQLIPTWTERFLSTTADGAWWVAAAAVDGDGDMDAVAASFQDTTVAWFDSDGLSPPSFTLRTISTATATRRCAVADLDGDGDLDVICPRLGPGTI